MFCTRCGTKNEDFARFCKKCGRELSAENRLSPGSHPYCKLGGWLAVITYGLLAAVGIIVLGGVIEGITLIRYAGYLARYWDKVKLYFLCLLEIVVYVPVVYFCIKMYQMIKNRDPRFLRFYERAILALAGAYIVLMLFIVVSFSGIFGGVHWGLFSFGDYFKPLLESMIVFVIYLAYFSKSVRVRTYFGTDEYLKQSIFLKNCQAPAPAGYNHIPTPLAPDSQNQGNNVSGESRPLQMGEEARGQEDEKEMRHIPIANYNSGSGIHLRSLICRSYDGQYGFFTLGIFREQGKEVESVMVDIILRTSFGNTYEVRDIGFTNFRPDKKYYLVSGITARSIPQDKFILIKEADIIIRKYIENGQVTEVSEENQNLCPFKEFAKKNEIAILLSELETLGSAKEILDCIFYYSEAHNCALDPELISRLEELLTLEIMEGSKKELGMEVVKEYFAG